MADVLISSELLVDDVQIDSGLNSSSIDIDTDIGSTTIIQTEAVKAYATEEEDGVLLTVIDFYGTTTGLVHNGEKGEQGEQGEQGIQGETGAAAGFGSVTASVDANIGTPSVEITTSGSDTSKNFAFAFHNLKGEKGETGATGATGATGQTGATGAAAGFGTVSASVDSNVGTPSVEVTTSGSDTSKNFSFAFHNLKGQQGEQGIQGIQGIQGETGQTGATGAAAGFGTVTATVDANVGTPSVEVSTSGTDTAKNFAFAFHNLKGQKGETGDGVPSGGTDGQLLGKVNGGTAWVNPPASGVTSVNGQTGAVTLSIPSATSDLTNDSGFITASDVPQEVFIATYGTTTYAEVQAAFNAGMAIIARNGEVNAILTNASSLLFQFKYVITTGSGKIGWYNLKATGWESGSGFDFIPQTRTVNGKALSSNITLTASDVGALPDNTVIPTATSDLTNDSGFITAGDVPTEVFFAEYGVATLAQVKAAITAGKNVIAYQSTNGDTDYAHLVYTSTVDDQCVFILMMGSSAIGWVLDSEGWNAPYQIDYVDSATLDSTLLAYIPISKAAQNGYTNSVDNSPKSNRSTFSFSTDKGTRSASITLEGNDSYSPSITFAVETTSGNGNMMYLTDTETHIYNLPTPLYGHQAANKSYVDNTVAAAIGTAIGNSY